MNVFSRRKKLKRRVNERFLTEELSTGPLVDSECRSLWNAVPLPAAHPMRRTNSVRRHSKRVTASVILLAAITVATAIVLSSFPQGNYNISRFLVGVKATWRSFQAQHEPLSRRNLALYDAGGRIVPELTSPTNGLLRLTWKSWFWRNIRGYDMLSAHVRPPTVVLEDDTRVGACWEFAGARGHITIRLPEPVHISEISLYNPRPELLSPAARDRVPQDMMLWGMVSKDMSEKATLVNLRAASLLTSPERFSIRGSPGQIIPVDSQLLLLTKLRYDISSSLSHQLFRLSQFAQTQVFQLLIFEVASNWGSNTTCVYKIGVHADT